ncbi:Crp/Fnr family transcriptional regulator [Methyloceanibacter sp.]|uniref:Crp/Fnr family transcriptional regulator n=1 Tax=Methyloceanibacter sp. TaxID=1965321 RepID=UPI002B673140|nr:Crp/Fnr family transcriptional regulator [Methyloceanibacter sp.]HML90829.1 Crp/Fnr family transcriptional regulator [Methyloceanibacter sp.]
MRSIAKYKLADRRVEAGVQLLRPGEPSHETYELIEGWAFQYALFPDGRRQILNFVLPGAILGFHRDNDEVLTYGVEALTNTVVASYRINASDVFERDLETGMQLLWLLSRDLRLAFDRLASVGCLSAQERVAHLLLELFIRSRMRWPGHQIEHLNLPLTQEHIGDATGLTSVHVNRMLRDLGKRGILEFQYRHLRILDPDRLVELAAVDPYVLQSWIGLSVTSADRLETEVD